MKLEVSYFSSALINDFTLMKVYNTLPINIINLRWRSRLQLYDKGCFVCNWVFYPSPANKLFNVIPLISQSMHVSDPL